MIKAIDFFCGAGGVTRGLLDAGIQVVAGVDIDTRLKATYEHNNPTSQFVAQDIRNIDIAQLREGCGISHADTVLYVACTPCQPFSTLNTQKKDDKRKDLLLDFAKLVQQSPPHYILVENVPGLNTVYGKDIYAQFKKILDEENFVYVEANFVDAKDYGVPQARKRFILLASCLHEISFPEREASYTSVRNAIAHYPPLEDGQASPDILNHIARKLQPHHKQIVSAVPFDGGSRRDVKDKTLLLPCHQKHPNAHKDVFGRMAWDEPAPTLTGRCADVYCGRFIHPEQNRGLSLREAASLQTFPDNYQFFGSFQFIARQIGNAVPVLLAKKLGEAIIKSAEEANL